MANVNNLPVAVCVVIFNKEGRILGASQRGQLTVFGLPGGKVDEGESLVDAIIRETMEETGVIMNRGSIIPLLEVEDGAGYYVHTFQYTRPVNSHCASQIEPDIAVDWVTPYELTTGRYGYYNNLVIQTLLHRAYVRQEFK